MKCYGYLRVSTEKQDIENNKADILKKANDLKISTFVEFVEETISGTVDWKQRELGILYDKLKPGDVLITSELSRFGRSVGQIMEFLSGCDKKKIKIYLTKTDFCIDSSLQSQIMQFAYSLSSQIERELISSRTKTGLERAKEKGVKLGRKRIMTLDKNNNVQDIQKLLSSGVKIYVIAKRYAVSTQTIYRFIHKHDLIIDKKDKDQDIVLVRCLNCNRDKPSKSYSKKNPKICRKCVISKNNDSLDMKLFCPEV